MKTIMLTAVFIASLTSSFAQSKTTEALQKNSGDVKVFFFYHNTLSMLNQKDDKTFDDLIKDIEKIKLLMISKPASFGAEQYKKIVSEYKSESFEEAMTSRVEGKNFDMFLKEKDKKVKGMLVLVNDKEMLYVLDIVGRIALDQVATLYKKIEESSDFSNMVKDLTKKKE